MVHLLLLLNCLFIFSASYAVPTTDPASDTHGLSGGISPMLKLLANVDGKAFFQEWGTKRDWTTAAKYCESFGMTLASITSQAQFVALRSAYDDDFSKWYWLSGRDTFEIAQFASNSTGLQLSPSNLPISNVNRIPFQTCLAWQSLPYNSSTLAPLQCSRTVGGVLCET